MNSTVNYPQYRKFPTNTAYFKIISDKEWEEIQVIGKKYLLHSFTVKILPDRNYLYDLTFDYKNNWLEIGEGEYMEIKRRAV